MLTALLILLAFVLFLAFVALNSIWGFFRFGVPMVSTADGEFDQVLKFIKPTDRIVELGSGIGRTSFALARTKARVNGFEYLWWATLLAKFANLFVKEKVEFKRADFFSVNLSQYNVVYFYLLPHLVNRAVEKIQKDHRAAVLIISCDFSCANLNPEQTIKTKRHTYYFYRLD